MDVWSVLQIYGTIIVYTNSLLWRKERHGRDQKHIVVGNGKNPQGCKEESWAIRVWAAIRN